MKNKPLRRCVACREMREKHALIRIAAAASEICIDTTGYAAGRGAYVCRSETCIKKAHKIKGLERSLKRAVPSEIYENLSHLSER